MQRQAMGVALHICYTFILNYCIAFNCYGADVEKHRHFFVRRAWRVVLRCDVNLTDLPDLYLSTCPCWMI
ncbi:hypothetical protein CQP30_15550 [Yersinia pestis]|uniref:Uncharacterized protein n=1 Tax=Yersinia pestis bv. Antiqua (strain Nepal516) TaxID=377628 RepID=A0A0H2YIS0_YERPN|nr:conserved hypothetical protein [Yersinia pestis Nepal516]ABP39214.1 conserved hypothetical protein [Yersinia pestis Pestoides F]AXY32839.1 hypothetical protein CEQ20_05020 [Yersinia pseudotuberculosis]EDR42669.1 conserved hypothetical protein [Yersinia pestis biovar Antiqua str. E1979001]EDR52615.1 conserved hypothetical protein [Yersinia pestis biovar Antiqua str. B42003004]EDR65914.1 conserved hypothetical protein [Yersinia pestis biovar Mediaevalis str. K1973002]EIQ89891.1 hypothetical 